MPLLRPASEVETQTIVNAGSYRSHYHTLSLGLVTSFEQDMNVAGCVSFGPTDDVSLPGPGLLSESPR